MCRSKALCDPFHLDAEVQGLNLMLSFCQLALLGAL